MAWYNWSQTATSNATADSTINWQEGQAPSSVNDSARAMMAATAKYRDDVNGSLTTSGTSTAYTLSSNSVYDTLAHLANQKLVITIHATSGAAPTLNVDTLGAKPIRQASGVALPAGALVGASVYSVSYNSSTGEFLLVDQLGVLPTGSVTTSTIAAGNVTYATIQNVGASSLLGNPTGSGAAPSEITLGGGLSFSGSTLKATNNPSLIPNYLSGLTLSTAGSSATMTIASGAANDSTNLQLMLLASAISKTTASWAVGSGNGGLDTDSIAINTGYHFFQIERTDLSATDVLFSLSATSPTMPANYTFARRIGWGKTDGSSHWLAFTQFGDDFIWAAQVADSTSTTTTTSRVATALSVPTGITVKAKYRAGLTTGSGGLNTLFTALSENDATPTASGAGGALISLAVTSGSTAIGGHFETWVNTSAQIGVRSTSTAGTTSISTYGWTDTRGK